MLTMESGTTPAVQVEDLDRMRRAGQSHEILDVREPWEVDLSAIPGSIRIPLGHLAGRVGEVPRDRPLVVMCHHGFRSAQAVAWLRSQGFDGAVNLEGGIDAWARRIDPTTKVY